LRGWFLGKPLGRLVSRTEEQRIMKKGLGKYSQSVKSTRECLKMTRRVQEVLGDARINMP
jgi:hypothetical protein